jgi:pimeloyl-ACP methyl ester carboxylesterase
MTNIAPFASAPDAQSHFISVGANCIHYVTAGNGGHTLVFVHGWACHVGFWREEIAALAGKARLILIDLPGHGQSDKPQTTYTMDFFAEAVLAVLQDAKVEKATLIGHSMGGAVIARVHHHAPEKVAALVSVDGLLCRLSGPPEEGQALVGGFASSHYREHAQGFISTFFPIPGTEALRGRVTSEMLATPQHVMLGGMLAMLAPDQPDWILQKVNAPVIVINAPTPWWNDAYENYVRSLSPQSDYCIMDGVGHFLMLEKPGEFNAMLVKKLQKFDLIAQ